MDDLERDLRTARPEWPAPSSGAEARARAALGLPASPRSARSWVARASRRRGTLIAIAALLVTGGAAVAATLIGGGQPATPGPRAAVLGFGPVHVIDTPVNVIEGAPAVTVDGRGVATLAWGRAGRIVVSSRPPGGEWSAPVRLSDPATRATYPRIGSDRDGAVTVTWRERTAGSRVEQGFRLPSGAPAGRLVEIAGRRWAVVSRTRPADGPWAPATRASPETATVRDLEEPGLVVSADGAAIATWDTGGTMWASRRPAAGQWGSPVVVGAGRGEAVDAQLAGSPSGGALLVWSNRVGLGADRRYEIRAAAIDADGVWEEARIIDDSARNAPHAYGARNARGDAAIAWVEEGSGHSTSFASSRPAGGHWAPGSRLGASRGVYGAGPGVTVDAAGRAIAVGYPAGAWSARVGGGPWRPLPLSPRPGHHFAATAVPDATGATLIVRSTFRPSRKVIERIPTGPGGAVRAAVVPGVGTYVAVAAGLDGTVAIAWAAALAPGGVAVAVSEGSP